MKPTDLHHILLCAAIPVFLWSLTMGDGWLVLMSSFAVASNALAVFGAEFRK